MIRKVLLHATNQSPRWSVFFREAQFGIGSVQGVELLAPGVWLLNADDPWLTVGEILRIARKYKIDCRTLEFDLESGWQNHPAPV